MKRSIKTTCWSALILGIILTAGTALAIPSLQLDVEGGTYDWSTQTIIAPDSTFTLDAYLIRNRTNTLGDTYYISAALVPVTDTANTDLGSFEFNGETIQVTADMVYGVPPLEDYLAADKGDLATHGIYPTYYAEFAFQFSSDDRAVKYDTQDDPGAGPTESATGTMYYTTFTIDTSNLAYGYTLHFDLYNTDSGTWRLCQGSDVDITGFAPFSHDAESGGQVPEPSTLLLMGLGLLGLTFWGARKGFQN